MCPHPENGLARASDPLNAHLGQEQRLTLQGPRELQESAPQPGPAACPRQRHSCVCLLPCGSSYECGHFTVAYRIMGGYHHAFAAGVAPMATAGPADTTPAPAYRGHST